MDFRLGVVGSRDFANYPLLESHLDIYRAKYPNLTIITGTPPKATDTTENVIGADQSACLYAYAYDLALIIHRADWDKYGKFAGPRRNSLIVADADEVIAFWDQKSRGTRDTLTKALAKGITAYVVTLDGTKYQYEG